MSKDLTSISEESVTTFHQIKSEIGSVKSVIGKPLGHINSLLFWSVQQRKIMDFLGNKYTLEGSCDFLPFSDERKSLFLLGDYGTGKTILLEGAVEILLDETIDIHFISALNYAGDTKWTEGVLDIAFRQKFTDTGVKFHSMATFRRK